MMRCVAAFHAVIKGLQQEKPMKFDSNQAWRQASSAISANRDVALALAGVFFLLPGLAMALFFPAPEPTVGLDREAAMALVSDYYLSILPVVLPMVLFQAAGTLALLTLLTDRTQPTVAQAIGYGLKGILPYFLAQLLLGVGIGVVGGLVLAVGAVTGVPVIAAIGIAVVALLAIYAAIKTSLVSPVIAVEQERNPVAALRRSWALTSGNSVRIGIFYVLVAAAFLIIILIVTALVGILMALFAEARTVEVVNAIVSSGINAAMALYFVAIIAATHRQLAGPSPQAESETFN